MQDAYLGIDIGSISTKGVIIDGQNHILASSYIWTEGDPIGAAKKLLRLLEDQFDQTNYRIMATGTGAFLSSQSKRLGVEVEDFGQISLQSKHPTQIAARCTVLQNPTWYIKSRWATQRKILSPDCARLLRQTT